MTRETSDALAYVLAKKLVEEYSKCLIYGCQYAQEEKPRKCVRCGEYDHQTFKWYGESIFDHIK